MTHLAARERQALCDTLERVGPAAPTLSGDWTTADLAAHLVIRERRPDLALGIVVPALRARTESAQAALAARPWAELVDLVRSGPPLWSPTRLPALDGAVNLVEFFVHHEDVLRGEGGRGPVREPSPAMERALWSALRRTGRLMLRRSPVGVVLVTDTARAAVHPPTGLGTVVLTGRASELLLYAYGRQRVADVEQSGPPEAVDALEGSPLGL